MELIPILKGIVPPVLVAMALVSAGGNRLLPFAVGLGLTMVVVLLTDWPTLPNELWSDPDGREWLFWGIIASVLVASLEHWRCLRGRVAMAVGIALAGAAVWFMMQKVAARESIGWNVFHVGGGGIAVAGLVVAGRNLIARAEPSPFFPVFIALILSVDAVVVTLGGSGMLGQFCGACAAGVGAAIVTSIWCTPFHVAVADGTWFGIAHGLFLLAGVHLSHLEWGPALLAGVAPALPLALPKSFAKKRPKRWMLMVILLAGIPATFAIIAS